MGNYIIGLGLGGDIGLKFRLSNFLVINAGTTMTWNFAGYREIRRNIDHRRNNYDLEKSGWVSRYSMIGIKPYIAIGFNFWN